MSILPWTCFLVILPNRIEGETMSVNKDQTMSTYSQHNILGDTKKNITNYASSLAGRQAAQDAQLLTKLSTVPGTNNKMDPIRKTSRSKGSRRGKKGHHHQERTDLDSGETILKEVSASTNASFLKDFLMQKIRVFSRVKLGEWRRVEPKENWTKSYYSTTIASKEMNEQYEFLDINENYSSATQLIKTQSVRTPDIGTKLIAGEQMPRIGISGSEFWHQHKRSSKQDQFPVVDEATTTSVEQRIKSEQSLEAKMKSQGKKDPKFVPRGVVSEQFDTENQKILFPLNINNAKEQSTNYQVDDPPIYKTPLNATETGRNDHTEYLNYEEITGPYISEELISQAKAFNRNHVSKPLSIDDSLNQPSENISKTELIDPRARPASISISSIVGLGLGLVMFFLILSVVSAMLLYKKQYLRKAESMDRSFVSCDSYSGSYADSETFNSISYADCAGIEIPKDNSSEELYNLDNDSFLNSLEAISFPEYWTDKL